MSDLRARIWPRGIATFAQQLERAGISIPPEELARLDAAYCDRIAEISAEAAAAAKPMGVDGLHYERPEDVARASAAVRHSVEGMSEADDALFASLARLVPESQQGPLQVLREEARVTHLSFTALDLGDTNNYCVYPWDVTWLLQELELTREERSAVFAVLAEHAPARLRTYQALLDSGLKQRRAMAELCKEIGITGMSSDEARRVLAEYDARSREQAAAAQKAGDPEQRFTDIHTRLLALRGGTPDVALAAMREQRSAVEDVARVLRPELAIRLKRKFRNECMDWAGMVEGQQWDSGRSGAWHSLWAARHVLSLPEVTGEKRLRAREILDRWAHEEDELGERFMAAAFERLQNAGSDPLAATDRGHRARYAHFADPALEALSAAHLAKLAQALDMPWLTDEKAEVPALPEVADFPSFSAADLALTGSLRPAHWRSPRTGDPEQRGSLGQRRLSEEDLAAIARTLAVASADRAKLAELAAAHAKAWRDRVDPLDTAAAEPQPLGKLHVETFGAYREPVEGVPEWRARVCAAVVALEQACRDVDQEFLDGVAAAFGSTAPEGAVARVRFSRRADAVIGFHASRVRSGDRFHFEVEPFGGRWVDPGAALDRARLSNSATLAAERELAPHLVRLGNLLEEERAICLQRRIRERRGEVSGPDAGEEAAYFNAWLDRTAVWREAEDGAFAAMAAVLSPEDAARLDRAANELRFSLFQAGQSMRTVGDELRAAVPMEDVEKGADMIATIDRWIDHYRDREWRGLQGRLKERREVVRRHYQSYEEISDARATSMYGDEQARRGQSLDSERAIWVLSRDLPAAVTSASPAFVRAAGSRGITLPSGR